MTLPLDKTSSLPTGAQARSEAVALKSQAAERERVRQAALEFEALLLSQMVRQMRQSLLDEEEQGEGLGASTLFDTLDVELARHLARQGGIGLARVLEQGLRQVDAGATGASTLDAASAGASLVAGIDVGVPTGQSAARPLNLSEAMLASPPAKDADDPNAVTLAMPFDAPTSSAFGWRSDPFHGKSRFHSGIDLAAAYGREVPAAAAGRVSFVGERGAYGQLVIVAHDDGVETRYAHLSSIEVEAGQELAKGEVVGRVGQSGRATGPHLHFEVLVDGERVDPSQVARGAAPLKNWTAAADFPIDRDSARRVE